MLTSGGLFIFTRKSTVEAMSIIHTYEEWKQNELETFSQHRKLEKNLKLNVRDSRRNEQNGFLYVQWNSPRNLLFQSKTHWNWQKEGTVIDRWTEKGGKLKLKSIIDLRFKEGKWLNFLGKIKRETVKNTFEETLSWELGS